MREWLRKLRYLIGLAVLWFISHVTERGVDAFDLVPKDKQGFEKWWATIKALPALLLHVPAYALVIAFLIFGVLLYWLRSRSIKPTAQPAVAVVAPEVPIPLTYHDEKLFQDFRSLFAEPGYVALYREHHFLSPFPRAAWLPLMRVTDTWTDAAHMFSHPKLEERALKFREAAGALANAIAKYTTPTDSGTHITTLPRREDPENPPQWVRDEAEEIHSLVPAFIDAHEELLKLGNSLGARPPQVQ